MVKVYCDNMLPGWLKELRTIGKIEIIQFPYECKNNKIKSKGIPTNPTFDTCNLTWDEADFTFDDCEPSDKYEEIVSVLKKSNQNIDMDARHLDSAYKSGCRVFLTNDKTDILSRKQELKDLLNIDVCDSNEGRIVTEKMIILESFGELNKS